ncbi:hypothetical protein V7S43_002855 [Phytophthora oleae]|uniref:Uncharacterized protein n=1 Tax=Phytophthora oleae TaxID=2107226 RepID=A0ABD3FZH3_9STRA
MAKSIKQKSSQESAVASRMNGSTSFFSVLAVVLTLDACLTDGTEIILPTLRFLLAYLTRFLAFYEPKVLALAVLVNDTIETMGISKQLNNSWNFTVALVTLVCAHHVIEAARTRVASRLRSSVDTTVKQNA